MHLAGGMECACKREKERGEAEFYVIRHTFWSNVHDCRFRLPTPSKIAAKSTLSRNQWITEKKKHETEIEMEKEKYTYQTNHAALEKFEFIGEFDGFY